jgi:hypothetical protein
MVITKAMNARPTGDTMTPITEYPLLIAIINTEGEPTAPGMMTPGFSKGRYTGRIVGRFATVAEAVAATGRDVFCFLRIGSLVAEDTATGRGQIRA